MKRSQMLATRTPLVVENGLVVGGHELEAEAGVRVLQAGGNAIDAVVAAAFVGFVVEPASCGVGGHGRLSVFLADRQAFVTIDGYVRAPLKAHRRMFEPDLSVPWHDYGHPQTVGRKDQRGHLSAAVPGAVAGLCTAHEMFGRLPLAQVLEPAIEIAQAGVPLSWYLALMINQLREEIEAYPRLAALLLRDGHTPRHTTPWRTGDRLDTSDLAQTLRGIAAHGPAAFYTGPVAEAIEREFSRNGGILSAADLSAYRPKILRENPARYRDVAYITAYDPVTYEALNILDQFDLASYGPDSLEFRHLAAEAFGHAFIDNMVHYGDPEHSKSPVNGLSSRAFGEHRAQGIRLDQAAPRPIAADDPWPYEPCGDAPEALPLAPTLAQLGGTSQMAAVDRDGNLTTLIASVSSAFGSLVLVPDTGIILNNSMHNFDPRPDHPNCIMPGKMPIFAAPSLVAVKDGRAVFGGCGSGGYRIMTGVLHTLIHVVDFGMAVQAAVDAPRVHCQGGETFVDARIPQALQDELAALGHTVVPQPAGIEWGPFGRVNAIWVDPENGAMHAGSGPALTTAAAGY